ncbi:MAG: PD-(D/E)XK nuclease family transposase [Erysipelotrichaceae bacterium]|nr:PD-(D/E)XK nuclease family transposase [Erysipelotrichaceae bacterium]
MNCINSTTINQRYLNEIENFRLFDDDFMSKVFGFRPEETEFLLQKILKKDDLKVIESIPEYSIKNLQGKSIRLDIKAIDSENRLYDIEIQRANEGSVPQRARYYSGLIDSNIMDKGDVP